MKIALVGEGVLRNVTEAHLGCGMKGETYPYPMGQHLRGYFGYVLDDLGSGLSEFWKSNKRSAVYFKDCLVVHGCGGFLYPIIVNSKFQNYQCSECGERVRYATRVGAVIGTRIDRITGRARVYVMYGITGRHEFRFKAILNLKVAKEFKEDFVAMIKFAMEEGVLLGKRRYKGRGRFELTKVNFYYVTMEDVRRRARELMKRESLTFHFVSDVVAEDFDCKLLLTGIKTSAKFFHPEYEPYSDPFCRVLWKERLPSRDVIFLDCKEHPRFERERVIPAGAKMRVQFKDANEMFYEGLAIAEMLRGVGKRTTFGKGEFVVV